METSTLNSFAHEDLKGLVIDNFTMPKAKRRRFMKEKEAKQLLNDFKQRFNIDVGQLLESKPHVELSETRSATIFHVNGRPLAAMLNDVLLPTLLFREALQLLPKIVVNMGAVPHICNGADLMAPGIVRIQREFRTNDYVLIADERHNQPLAVATALMDSKEARCIRKGKVARNLHYVGDALWNYLRASRKA